MTIVITFLATIALIAGVTYIITNREVIIIKEQVNKIPLDRKIITLIKGDPGTKFKGYLKTTTGGGLSVIKKINGTIPDAYSSIGTIITVSVKKTSNNKNKLTVFITDAKHSPKPIMQSSTEEPYGAVTATLPKP